MNRLAKNYVPRYEHPPRNWEAVLRDLERTCRTDAPRREPLSRSAIADRIGWAILIAGTLVGLAILVNP